MGSNCVETAEWLEADGLGGFASGTVTGTRTRRYHGLLLAATTPPTGRVMLVNGFDAWLETPGGTYPITSQRYAPDVVHPDGASRIESFEHEPWPRWLYRLPDGTSVIQEICASNGAPVTIVTWRLEQPRPGIKLYLRPLLSGRDYHALHHENDAFRWEAYTAAGSVRWQPYPDLPVIVSMSNASYTPSPDWYRNFLYRVEQERGLDHVEDLASPGVFEWDLSAAEAVLILAADGAQARAALGERSAVEYARRLRTAERKRRRSQSRLERAADAYLARRGDGSTIVAGYPWFTDWGRDTFIALRGLCLAAGRLAEARGILLAWAPTVSQGMLPNRFADRDDAPEFNSVDASLWYVVAVHDFLAATAAAGKRLAARDLEVLRSAVEQILDGYAGGTRYRIRADADGLIAAGEPGVQLTWMDAKVGDWVVTPRIGKPVEIQALWLNALHVASAWSERWAELLTRARAAFEERFWNEERGCLFDVVDADHSPGANDGAFRPNQILAVGGLPLQVLEGEKARRVVDAVESRLWTPFGLRSLAPGEPGYAPRYEGGVRERDGAYHQGTVWPWLLGPFVEAWVRVRGGKVKAKREARTRFLDPLLGHLDEAGLGHISEIADAEPPHTPRGCPFQAWSVGEALRLDRVVLAD